MNRIVVDPERTLGSIDRNIFGGFAEHLGRCIYGGIYDPGSPLADELGLRTDVVAALSRLRLPVIRYPGGNFASGYCWQDGIGPLEQRPSRLDLAWHSVETNRFGTDEFIRFCRQLGAEPYLVANCGDGDLREARDWVEYCNGTEATALVRRRQQHGFPAPHRVKYWGIGNEVEGDWQIGSKTPEEYARSLREFGKVMKWVDPQILLVASGTCTWEADFVERGQLILEQASDLVDYLAVHWYVGNRANDFAAYMALSEQMEERLSAYEGLIRAMRLARKIARPIHIAVDEWNVWYRTGAGSSVEEVYNLEDALVVAMHFNAFIRHAAMVRMANIAQIVNVIAPILTRPDGLVLQTIFYPFELFSRFCGDVALDPCWFGDTFTGGTYAGVRRLDVAATLDTRRQQIVLFVVNRDQYHPAEAAISLASGQWADPVRSFTINGTDVKTENTFDQPHGVRVRESTETAAESTWMYTFEPHSVTALICPVVR